MSTSDNNRSSVKKGPIYPAHKTVTLVDGKVVSTPEKKTGTSGSTFNTNNSGTIYPAHKTVDITVSSNSTINGNTENVNTNKEKEQNNINNEPKINLVQSNSYPEHKTVLLSTDTSKTAETTTTAENTSTATKKIQSNNASLVNDTSNGSYPAHKTFMFSEEAETIVTEHNDIPSNLSVSENTHGQQSYPSNKTVQIEQEKEQNFNTLSPQRTQSTLTKENSFPVAETKNNINNSYPAHKTFVLSQENITTPITQQQNQKNTETIVANEQKNTVNTIKTETANIQTIPAGKAKKPVLWIAISAVLLAASGVSTWYALNQKSSLQTEIETLKASNASLAEDVKRLQKDLHFDDIIARAGKLDSKNNILVSENASTSEIVRVCFSIAANGSAKRGKKQVYIRILNAENKLLGASNSNTFEYNGEKIPYTVKEQIDYKLADMMLCVDYKPSEKIEKGTYKAEIYSEGVLDGTAKFDLK